MFFKSKLRQAIAHTFPNRYNRFTWRQLLPDFVDLHTEAFLTKLNLYELEKQLNPDATYPAIRDEFKQAVVLLAKERNYKYEYLALTQYLLQYELAAEKREANHYRKQAEGFEKLAEDYKRLADQAIANLGTDDNL